MIFKGDAIQGPLQASADVCIIGSGCGGGASAKILAEAGRRVVVLEEGGSYSSKDFNGTEEWAYPNLYQQRAGQATEDLAVTILQGRCVGGSSTVNWCTTLRTPEWVLEAWSRTYGVEGLGARDLEPYFERIERYLNANPEPEENHSPNNRIILDGGRALNYHVRANNRNVRECVRAGACGLGCPFDAKLSVDRTYLPDAERVGAAIYANCRAEKITLRAQMKRVEGVVLDERTQRPRSTFVIEAPVVIVSGSAIHSPVLLEKSGLANSSGQRGRNLTLHLTSAVIGLYDRMIYPGGGIPQSALCDEFLNKEGDGGGFWIESVPVYPALAGLSLPSFGTSHREMMQLFPHLGALIVLVKEADSAGRVSVNSYGRPAIAYRLGQRDRRILQSGLQHASLVHFAAGARRVMTLHATPTEFHSSSEVLPKLSTARYGTNDLSLFSAHPLGTCRMGKDSRSSVVDSHCHTHDVRGLFVIDGSVTPTSLGVNPQLTILAIAEKSAEWIADHFRSLVS
jgi:choline dehydrogenase-like flavoprotein